MFKVIDADKWHRMMYKDSAKGLYGNHITGLTGQKQKPSK